MAKTRFYQTKDLFKETFSLIESSEEEYKKFLDFSSKHYKYTFQDIILIYNQRPNATAVTDMSTWNSIFARRVNRGTQSIAVFDSNSNTGLNYLFDVGDTNGQTPPVHWKYEKQHESELKKTFYEKIFATKATTDLEYEYIGDIIDTKIINDCSKYIDDIYKNVDDSPLESQDRSLVESKFVCAVVDSVGEIIQSRTGITCKGFIEVGLTLSALVDFSTQALRAMVHTAINEISKDKGHDHRGNLISICHYHLLRSFI